MKCNRMTTFLVSDSRGHADPMTPLNGVATCYCPFAGRIGGTQHSSLLAQAGVKQLFVELSILSAYLIG